MKALIRITDSCNNNCIFCHSKEIREGSPPVKSILEKIQFFDGKADMILLSGGEPTVSKDFKRIIAFLKTKSMPFGLITNGRMLSDKAYCEMLYSSGLRYVYISLHSHDPKIHNDITRSDSFFDTVKGIRNLSVYDDIEKTVNTVVIRANLESLSPLVSSLKGMGCKIKFSHVFIRGNARKNIEIVPRFRESWTYIKTAIDLAISEGINVGVENIPFCIMKDYARYLDDFRTNGIAFKNEADQDYLTIESTDDCRHYSICESCSRNDVCEGININYAKEFGMDDFGPL